MTNLRFMTFQTPDQDKITCMICVNNITYIEKVQIKGEEGVRIHVIGGSFAEISTPFEYVRDQIVRLASS